MHSDGNESLVAQTVKDPPEGDLGSILGLGRSPGGGHGTPLQCSYLEKSMDRGAWWATVHGVAKSWTQLSMPLTKACPVANKLFQLHPTQSSEPLEIWGYISSTFAALLSDMRSDIRKKLNNLNTCLSNLKNSFVICSID